jgi:hypothetical protein
MVQRWCGGEVQAIEMVEKLIQATHPPLVKAEP